MRDSRAIYKKLTGAPASGYTLKAYAYSTGSSGYSGSALYTYTDNSDGTYYADITTTIIGTIVITTPSGSTIVPSNLIGIKLEGDNQSDIAPPGTT